MTPPTINVNLKPCPVARAHEHLTVEALHGAAGCPASPVPIPCPVPRSVTFSVALACTCHMLTRDTQWHDTDCPARPVRVSCFIMGETWAESEVTDVEFDSPYAKERMSQGVIDSCGQICRARWALVKALVLGRESAAQLNVHKLAIFKQRDAVFAALADMARAEEDALQAQQRFYEACSIVLPTERRDERPSIGRLAAFVDYLVEQVAVLP